MKKNIPILSFTIILAIVIRCIFSASPNLTYLVAAINIIAILFVVFTIVYDIIYNVQERIKESGVPKQIQTREMKKLSSKIYLFSIVITVTLTVLYFFLWCSSLGNDVISILALGLSILDDEIVDNISRNIKI